MIKILLEISLIGCQSTIYFIVFLFFAILIYYIFCRDLIKLEDGIGEKVSMFTHHQVAFVGSIILAFVKGWLLALICLTSLPATMIAMGIVSRVSQIFSFKVSFYCHLVIHLMYKFIKYVCMYV